MLAQVGRCGQRMDAPILPAEIPPELNFFFELIRHFNLRVFCLVRDSGVQVSRHENRGWNWELLCSDMQVPVVHRRMKMTSANVWRHRARSTRMTPPTGSTLGSVFPEAPFNYSFNLMFPTLALTGLLEIPWEMVTSDVFPFLFTTAPPFLSPPVPFGHTSAVSVRGTPQGYRYTPTSC